MIDTNQAARLLGGDAIGRNGILCPGPGHSRKDRSLSVGFTADGSFIVNSFVGDDWRACREHVAGLLGWSDQRPSAPSPMPDLDLRDMVDVQRRIDRGMAIWDASLPLPGTTAEAYLASRDLAYDGTALRFHPHCPFRQERHPAMVALMTDAETGEPRGVHRTALLPSGSGKAAPGKMMLGNAKGSVVRLYDHEHPFGLGIAEGIETALATAFRPMWACLTAGGIAGLPVLPGVDALTIFADHDASGAGEKAADACAARWFAADVEVTIRMPIEVGVDYATQKAA